MSATISRAFEQPLTNTMSEAEFAERLLLKEVAETPLHLASNTTTNAFLANPGYSHESLARVQGAIVKVETDTVRNGSGFITTDAHGRQVVVTAGHVVGELTPASIRLTDRFGNKTTAGSGNYIMESHGVFLQPHGDEGVPEVDVAVLRPKEPIGTEALRIGSLALRGTWLDLINYQRDAPFDQPHRYKGVVLTHRLGTSNYAMTGVEPERKNESPANYVVQPGASGGVMWNPRRSEVAGLSFFGSNILLQPEDRELFNVSFDIPTGEETGLYPLLVHLTDPTFILRAITRCS